MALRAVHFALTNDQLKELLSNREDESRVHYIENVVEEQLDEEFTQETDAAWDAIHRCLTGHQGVEPGKLNNKAGSYPLNQCFLGGEALYFGTDYVVRLIKPAAIVDLAKALESIDVNWMQQRYKTYCLDAAPNDFREDEFEYTWYWFDQLREFMIRMVATGRSIIFTVGQ